MDASTALYCVSESVVETPSAVCVWYRSTRHMMSSMRPSLFERISSARCAVVSKAQRSSSVGSATSTGFGSSTSSHTVPVQRSQYPSGHSGGDIKQIKEKRYADKFRLEKGKTIHLLGIAFSSTGHTVQDWKEEVLGWI